MRNPALQIALATLLPGAILLPVWLLGGLGAGEDELLYYYPNRTLLAQTVSAGHWPWLNPWTGLDRPLLADPQAALFYPGTWLFLILPVPFAFAAVLWVHYSLAWLGTAQLLDGIVTSPVAKAFGATAFAFGGFMLAHRTHLTMLQSAAWLPWVLVALLAYVRTGGATHLLLSAGCVALQCLAGHVQIAALTAVGSILLVFGREFGLRRWLWTWLAGVGLFAIQWSPTERFVALCTRTERGYYDFIENAWHPLSTVGLLFPMFFGQRTPNLFPISYWGPNHQVEQMVYPGLIVLLLLLLAWPLRRRPNLVRWFALLALALGIATAVLCPLLYLLPGANLFRVPARAMVLGQLAVAVIAAVTLDQFDLRRSPEVSVLRARGLQCSARPLLLAVDVALVLIIAGLLCYPWVTGATSNALALSIRPWNPGVWIPVLLLAATLFALRHVLQRWEQPALRWLLLAVLVVDLGVVGWTVDVPAGWQTQRDWLRSVEREIWRDRVLQSSERLWVVNARQGSTPGEYIRPLDRGVANTNLLEPFGNLTDYGPLQPRNYQAAFGFEPWGELKEPDRLLTNPNLLARCNVGWVLISDPERLAPLESRPVLQTPEGSRLYRLPNSRGAAFLDAPDVTASVFAEAVGPNRMRIRVDSWVPLSTDEPITLVVSRLAQPGWTATRNGEPIELIEVDDLLLGARIPRGQLVELQLTYFPPGLMRGALISGTTLLLLLLGVCWERRSAVTPAATPA